MTTATAPDLIQLIAKIRRTMPRQPDVMALCDAFEIFLTSKQPIPAPTAVPNFAKEQRRARAKLHDKPWKAAGVSRATWFRRQKEKKE
jgi:hypothetical protein